jgi:hypothetical protein
MSNNENEVGTVRKMSNETSMKHLSAMFSQTLAGMKLLKNSMKGAQIGRVLDIYMGLPFVKPEKAIQNENERVLLQGLIKLNDLRITMLELVNDEGEIKANGSDASLETSPNDKS